MWLVIAEKVQVQLYQTSVLVLNTAQYLGHSLLGHLGLA